MIIDSLLLQTKLFLSGDMGIKIDSYETFEDDSLEKLELFDYTSMIGTGGKLNLLVVISYENDLLEKLVELFLDGEEIQEEERQEVTDSVSGEVINTIIGLALPTFPNRGKGVTITPPITINDASNIFKHKNSKIISAKVQTQYGQISISAIGPD